MNDRNDKIGKFTKECKIAGIVFTPLAVIGWAVYFLSRNTDIVALAGGAFVLAIVSSIMAFITVGNYMLNKMLDKQFNKKGGAR